MDRPIEELKRFNYIIGETNALYHEAALRLGISDSALDILYTICEIGEGCKQIDICKLCGSSRQTINSSIRKLEREQILYLKAGQGRNTRVFLTQEGKKLVEEKVLPLIAIENEILQEWEERETQELLRLTEKYKDDLKRKLNVLA